MDDLISREALRDALEALSGVGGIYLWDPEKVLEAVEKAPGAVVRCQECKHCRLASWGERYCIRDKYVEWTDLQEDSFCSFGERRGE